MRLLLFVLMCAVGLSANAASARAELEQFLGGLSTLKAEFGQRLLDEQNRLVESARGELFVKRPGNFRWNYTHPYPQEIVGAKNYVWVYDSDLEQVSVKPMDAALGNSPAILLTTDRPLDELFKVKDLGTKNGINWVELTPRSDDATFESFRVGMAEGVMTLMELKDNFGQTTQLSFSNISRNPALEEGLFDFIPPKGADVVGDGPKK